MTLLRKDTEETVEEVAGHSVESEEELIQEMIASDLAENDPNDHERLFAHALEDIDNEFPMFVHNEHIDDEDEDDEFERHRVEEESAKDAAVAEETHEEQPVSYQETRYDSEEMHALLRAMDEPDIYAHGNENHKYKPANVFPLWLLKSRNWQTTKAKKGDGGGQDVSEILRIAPANRSAEQQSILVYWIMSVWQTANVMGIKKVHQMLQEFKYISYEPEENIITEGEAGLTFYIIISGECNVHKAGIGIVAKLGRGKGFGELALTKGDVRTATIRTISRCEVLSLHKLDYDHFVKDIQQAERREHFFLLRECSLFLKWNRSKVDKLCNTCTRKTFEAGTTVFKQGDEPDKMYVVMEGVIEIIKEVHIVCKNRWPTALGEWKDAVKTTVKPIRVSVIRRGGYFGELGIVRSAVRAATAVCQTKCTLVMVDKLELMHHINHSKTSELAPLTRGVKAYPSDEDILKVIGEIRGGPQSRAQLGDVVIMPNKIEKREEIDPRAASRMVETAKKKKVEKKEKGEGGPRKRKTAIGGGLATSTANAAASHLEDANNAASAPSGKKADQLSAAGAVTQQSWKELKAEAEELAAARRLELLIAESIEASTKHRPVVAQPLAALGNRGLSHSSLHLAAAAKPYAGSGSKRGGDSALACGLGSFAAALDPMDGHVEFVPRAMLDRPKGRSWNVHVPQEDAMPLLGTVTAVKRVPTGTSLRRLGSPIERSKSLPALAGPKGQHGGGGAHDIFRPMGRPESPPPDVPLRDFINKPVITYRDALSRSGLVKLKD